MLLSKRLSAYRVPQLVSMYFFHLFTSFLLREVASSKENPLNPHLRKIKTNPFQGSLLGFIFDGVFPCPAFIKLQFILY